MPISTFRIHDCHNIFTEIKQLVLFMWDFLFFVFKCFVFYTYLPPPHPQTLTFSHIAWGVLIVQKINHRNINNRYV